MHVSQLEEALKLARHIRNLRERLDDVRNAKKLNRIEVWAPANPFTPIFIEGPTWEQDGEIMVALVSYMERSIKRGEEQLRALGVEV